MARGLGTRMRKSHSTVTLDNTQSAIADLGLKAMIPTGRPFLDYVLSGVADAGFNQVCLVIGPEHDVVRNYYMEEIRPQRLSIQFAIQERPLGTADAVAAAADFADDEFFLVMNSDNYYPVESLQGLRGLSECGLAGFSCEGLLRDGQMTMERIGKYALLSVDDEGYLSAVIEKPETTEITKRGSRALVSMNLWIFSPNIFSACTAIEPSVRGEFEIADAVTYAMKYLGEKFRVLSFDAPVLDLTHRADIEPITKRLARLEVRL